MNLFKETFAKNKQWRTLIGFVFNEYEIQEIASEVSENLKNPMLPIPLLRREARNYCTIVQDLLGNSFNEPSSEFSIPTTAETIFANIYNHESMLLGEYRTPKSKNSLFKARWLIAKNPDKSELKNFTYSALRRRKTLEDMFLLQILNVLKGTIRSHCRTVISKLERIDELKTFMSEYCISVILM